MNQILCCDWLPELTRWRPLGLIRCLPQENSALFHIIYYLWAKLIRSTCLNIDLFWRVYGPRLRLAQYPAISTFGQQPIFYATRKNSRQHI